MGDKKNTANEHIRRMDVAGPPPQYIVDEILTELAQLASVVPVDANWREDPRAVKVARIFAMSFYVAAKMGDEGWPIPLMMQSEAHYRWWHELKACLTPNEDNTNENSAAFFAAKADDTKRFLQKMKDDAVQFMPQQ